jgi:hypothetical protein
MLAALRLTEFRERLGRPGFRPNSPLENASTGADEPSPASDGKLAKPVDDRAQAAAIGGFGLSSESSAEGVAYPLIPLSPSGLGGERQSVESAPGGDEGEVTSPRSRLLIVDEGNNASDGRRLVRCMGRGRFRTVDICRWRRRRQVP